jgi:carbonic anhydrase
MRWVGRGQVAFAGLMAITVLVSGAGCQRAGSQCAGTQARQSSANESEVQDAQTAVAALRAGNLRFVASSRTLSTDTAHDAKFRQQTAKAQHPLAAVLCCSDSRVSPEFIFDQRLGSIFEVRNAGNVVDEDVLGSLEYAVEHLHVPLVVVLGHKGCGAIEAVCEAGDTPLHDHLQALQAHMQGIRQQVLDGNHRHDAEIVDRLSEENARQQALSVLRDSPVVQRAVEGGEVWLMYAIYDMETGAVSLFDLDAGG